MRSITQLLREERQRQIQHSDELPMMILTHKSCRSRRTANTARPCLSLNFDFDLRKKDHVKTRRTEAAPPNPIYSISWRSSGVVVSNAGFLCLSVMKCIRFHSQFDWGRAQAPTPGMLVSDSFEEDIEASGGLELPGERVMDPWFLMGELQC